MNNKRILRLITITAVVFPCYVSAASLDKIQFIKIAPQDAKAVMKRADGKLAVIKQGDAIAEGVMVKEIAAGRIVLEENTDRGPETVIVRLDNGRQRIERLRKLPENTPGIVAPARSDK
jgi:hypothetical protein